MIKRKHLTSKVVFKDKLVPINSIVKRKELGQFFTPVHVADLMSSMFVAEVAELNLLDAGAGDGALSASLIDNLCLREKKPKRIRVTAFEIDAGLIIRLGKTLNDTAKRARKAGIDFSYKIYCDDFLTVAVSSLRKDLFSAQLPAFNAAIVNPPYKKLKSDSKARLWLRSIGIETSNYYSAFTALILRLLDKGGELVAITPRSFCNGPYFRQFRSELLSASSIHRLHVFESRTAAFNKDNVLQENVIYHAIKGETQSPTLTVSRSTGEPRGRIQHRELLYTEVVIPNDPERFIHIDLGGNQVETRSQIQALKYRLEDLDLKVSTGRVVDFRAKAHLRMVPDCETVPLIYPIHFNGGFVEWPRVSSKKPNAIVVNSETQDLLLPSAVYVLVKRFSSKEERRRIVACTFDPDLVVSKWVGFENHLNCFYSNRTKLSLNLAKGLVAFLNSTIVDQYFRLFSGHTQVNATDLRTLNYPSRSELERLGTKCTYPMKQSEIDQLLNQELFNGVQHSKSDRQNAK